MVIDKELPLYDKPFYSYNTTLSNKDYKLTFRYNRRMDTFNMTIEDAEGSDIIKGVNLVAGSPLLSQYSLESIEGDFILVPRKRLDLEDWGVQDGRKVSETHNLLYIVPEEESSGAS